MLVVLLLSASTAFAADRDRDGSPATAGKRNIPDHNMWHETPTLHWLLSGGYGADFRNSNPMGLKGTVDYLFTPAFTAGVEANLFFGNTTFNSDRTPSAGLRASYHLLRPGKNLGGQRWDLYTGLSSGADFGAGDKAVDEVEAYADAHLGARYLISDNWFLSAELATRNAMVGVSWRF